MENVEELKEFLERALSLRNFLENHCSVDEFSDCDAIIIFARDKKVGFDFINLLFKYIPEIKSMKYDIRKDRYDCKPTTASKILSNPMNFGKVRNIKLSTPDGTWDNAKTISDQKIRWIDLNGFQSHESVGVTYDKVEFQRIFNEVFPDDEKDF